MEACHHLKIDRQAAHSQQILDPQKTVLRSRSRWGDFDEDPEPKLTVFKILTAPALKSDWRMPG